MKDEVKGAQGCLFAVVLFLALVTVVVVFRLGRMP